MLRPAFACGRRRRPRCRSLGGRGAPGQSSAPFSSEAADGAQPQPPPDDAATIVQGPSLLAATGAHRPSPSLFHLPGLRSLPVWTAPGGPSGEQNENQRRHRIAFNDPMVTSAVQHVEANYKDIRAEYFAAVLGQGHEVDPQRNDSVSKPLEPDYDVASKGGEHADDALHKGSWDWHSYILNGAKNEGFRERCPKTALVVDDLEKEGMLFGTPFSFCFFSTLHGNSSIQAHTGPMNLRLRMHLPLVVPKKAEASSSAPDDAPRQSATRPAVGMRVADQIREWHEGSAVVLDDSYVHEVWNDTGEPRVLFLLDVWHPDVRRDERERITNMFAYAREKGWVGASK